jgi:large subunit ribosomal protein L16
MLQPIRTKFRKAHKGRIHGVATSGTDLAFGQYGLKATEPDRVTARQIEAARRALTRHMKRSGRVWIRIFPDVPVSKKPIEVRMGKGKGTPELWVCRFKPGRILFEVDGIPLQAAREALALAAAKLPVKTRFIERISE